MTTLGAINGWTYFAKRIKSDGNEDYLKKDGGSEGWYTFFVKVQGGQADDSIMSSAAKKKKKSWLDCFLYCSTSNLILLCLFDFEQADINCLVELWRKPCQVHI